jgi:glycosyltransferase, group 1 family
MRIGLFTDTYPPYINGVSTSVHMLKIALENLGHEVFVVTVNQKASSYDFEEDGHIIKVPGVKTGIYDYRLTSMYPLKIAKKIKKMNLDIIHVHTEFSIGSFGRIIAKQLNIPIVATYHTYYEDYLYYVTKGYFNYISKNLLKTLTQFYADKTVNSLIVPAEKIKDLFINKYNYKKEIAVIPTGIAIERFYKENVDKKKKEEIYKSLKVDKDDFLILFVGRVAEEKNIKFLIEAHKKLVKEDNKYKLIIVGDGPDIKNLKELSKDIKDNVVFAGKSLWEDVPCYYDIADIFVTASRSETQGLTVLEALASSTPVVCANDPSYIDAIVPGSNGFVFDTEEEYLENIKKLRKDNKLREEFSINARNYSENFSSSKYAKRVLDVYEKAIKDYKNFKNKYIEEIIG